MESSELQKTHLNLVSRPSRYCGVSGLFIIAHATVAYLLRALWLGGTLAFTLSFVRLRASSLCHLRFAIPFLRVCGFCGGGVRSDENRNSLDNCCTFMRARDKGKSVMNGSARTRLPKPNHLAGRCCYGCSRPMLQEAGTIARRAPRVLSTGEGSDGHWVKPLLTRPTCLTSSQPAYLHYRLHYR